MSRKFDRFMVDVHVAANPKFARLTIPEKWCHVAGILSLAAVSPVRGYLLIGEDAAGPVDIAARAGVSTSVARSTLAKLERVGVLIRDDDLGCLQVHDWDDWNPAPKQDKTSAERARRYRERKQRHGSVTPPSRRDEPRDVTPSVTPVTPPEVEVEVEVEVGGFVPHPPRTGIHGVALAETVRDVMYVLAQCKRFHVDRVAVENIVIAHPGKDPVNAARSAVAKGQDPAWQQTNGARVLELCLTSQKPSDAKAERTARRLASLEALGGNHAA